MSKIDLSNVFPPIGSVRIIVSKYFPFPSHDDPEVFIHASMVEGTLYVSEEAWNAIKTFGDDVLAEGSCMTIV